MAARIIISNPQNIQKDCYASVPKIDLTLRCNGEESVMVMDALGQLTVAGFTPPQSAAVLTTTGTAGSFTINMYWNYAYVYVAKYNYPLVENAVTGGGSPAPRSNPSPLTAANSTVNTNQKSLAIPTSSRTDISHIWVYSTTGFSTLAEAADFAEAGNMYWIGEVENNPNLATVPFVDTGALGQLEQIENDNFVAPQFDKVVYSDPFFWGFGNHMLTVPVTVTTTGLITTTDKWYDGRDGQTIRFAMIANGGYDNRGSFYFKFLSNTTAQLYSDIALTAPEGLSVNGTTEAYIQGPSTILYRSKPRNPFSWGFTDIIGDLQVPAPYTFSVGGGHGTAIAVIPNQNLLKLDTEAPNKCYTLNLKNAGTPNFESSLRVLSDSYCVSTHHSQFSATLDRGQTVLWGIDSKSFSVIQSDGASQIPISSMVYKTMRQMSLDEDDRKYFHGIYCPRLELNCIFIKTEGSPVDNINKCIFQHAPTGYWGVLDVQDVLCSTQIFDSEAGQMKVIVGTEVGYIGEMFADGLWHNWFVSGQSTTGRQRGYGLATTSAVNELKSADRYFRDTFTGEPFDGLVGNWVTIVFDPLYHGVGTSATMRYMARITGVSADGSTLLLTDCLKPDSVRTPGNHSEWIDTDVGFPGILVGDVGTRYFVGLIEMQFGRTFSLDPYDNKKLQEVLVHELLLSVSSIYSTATLTTVELADGYLETPMQYRKEVPVNSTSLAVQTNLAINESKIFSVIFRDRGFNELMVTNYEIRMNKEYGSKS